MSETEQRPARRGGFLGILIAFALGLGVMAWLVTGTEAGRELAGKATLQEAQPLLDAPAPPAPQAAPVPAPAGDLAFRLASLESRMALMESRGAGGGAGNPRAEAMLIVLSASRRVERGEALGALERELSARFGTSDAAGLQALAAFSRAPVKLASLQQRYEAQAAGFAKADGWWDRLTDSLSSLVTVRDATRQAGGPAHAAVEARRHVAEGRLAEALAALKGVPLAADGQRWVADANRLVQAQQALARLEDLALSAPEAEAAAPQPEVREVKPVEGDAVPALGV